MPNLFQTVLNTRRMDALASNTARDAAGALEFVAHETAGQAQGNIRAVGAIDTGFMIGTTRARRISAMVWSIGTAAFYGVFIEFGTRFMSARPWLLPAMRQGNERLERALRAMFRDV